MATSINADNGAVSGSAGLKSSADSSGVLALQTNGTTAVSISAAQVVSYTNQPVYSGGTANGVAYLNGSKVLTTGSALVFDGTNLGVGTTPSAWGSSERAIQLAGTTFGNGVFSSSNNTAVIVGANAYYSSTGYKRIVAAASSIIQFVVGETRFLTAGSSTADSAITFTQAMTLDASGRLGIGTTSPTTPLQIQTAAATGVNSIFCTGSTTSYNFWTISNTSGNARIGVDSSSGGALATGSAAYSTVIGSSTATSLHLISNGVVGATLDTSGNLLVGTTSQLGSGKVGVLKSTAGQVLVLQNSVVPVLFGDAPYGISISYTGGAPNNTQSEFLYFDDNTPTLRMSVRSNGGIANYSANNVNLSDRREKTNFAPAKSYLDVICAIPVQTFNYIDQNFEEDDGLTLGVVAQDVQAVAPELVMESNWAGKDEEPKMRLSIYQTDLQYALMKCIQEQQALITQLQADVAALKGA